MVGSGTPTRGLVAEMFVLQFQCPHCGGVFQVDQSMAGQQVGCPLCQGVVAIGVEPSIEKAAEPAVEPTAGASPPPLSRFASGALPPALDRAAALGRKSESDVPPPLHRSPGPDPSATSAATTAPVPMPTASIPSAPATQWLGCPHCNGTFQVTADMAGQQVACPHCGGVVGVPDPMAAMSRATDTPVSDGDRTGVTAATPDAKPAGSGEDATDEIKETPKKIVLGEKVFEVRRLSREEKERRRFRRNMIMAVLCALVLVGVLSYLQHRRSIEQQAPDSDDSSTETPAEPGTTTGRLDAAPLPVRSPDWQPRVMGV